MRQLLFALVLLQFCCTSNKQVILATFDNQLSNQELTGGQIQLISNTASHFPNETQFAIALIEGENVLYYGLIRQNDTLKQIDNSESVFEIGSITKVFTSHLLINLLNNENISSLDEPIGQYLDFTIKNNPDITFKHLANHTSGFPSDLSTSVFNAQNPYKSYSKDKFVNFISKNDRLNSKPGEKYQYSNLGMGLLGYTIRIIKKKDFESLLKDEILIPLQMESTTSRRETIANKLVPGYNWKGKPTSNWDMAELESAGAILSTAKDLAKYALWNFKALNNELKQMTIKTISVNETLDVSIGWHIIKNQTKNEFLWHNGGTGGYKSSMALDAQSKTSIIILTNVGATNNPQKGLIDKLCFELMKTLE